MKACRVQKAHLILRMKHIRKTVKDVSCEGCEQNDKGSENTSSLEVDGREGLSDMDISERRC